jgi:excisionase family DNA binding protein
MKEPSQLPKLLFGVEEAASVLSISPWTVRAQIRRGAIPTVRIGDRQLVRSDELDRIATNGLKSL